MLFADELLFAFFSYYDNIMRIDGRIEIFYSITLDINRSLQFAYYETNVRESLFLESLETFWMAIFLIWYDLYGSYNYNGLDISSHLF